MSRINLRKLKLRTSLRKLKSRTSPRKLINPSKFINWIITRSLKNRIRAGFNRQRPRYPKWTSRSPLKSIWLLSIRLTSKFPRNNKYRPDIFLCFTTWILGRVSFRAWTSFKHSKIISCPAKFRLKLNKPISKYIARRLKLSQ